MSPGPTNLALMNNETGNLPNCEGRDVQRCVSATRKNPALAEVLSLKLFSKAFGPAVGSSRRLSRLVSL